MAGRNKAEALKLLEQLNDEVIFVVRHDDSMREFLQQHESDPSKHSTGKDEIKGVNFKTEKMRHYPQGTSENIITGNIETTKDMQLKQTSSLNASAISQKSIDFSSKQRIIQELSIKVTKGSKEPLGFGVAGGLDTTGISKPITIRRVRKLFLFHIIFDGLSSNFYSHLRALVDFCVSVSTFLFP